MRRRKKLAFACGVLAVGVAVAVLSRGQTRRPISDEAAQARRRPAPHRLATLIASPVSVPDEPVELPRLLNRIEPVEDESSGMAAEQRERITAEPLFGDSGALPDAAAGWRPSTKSPPLRAEPDVSRGPSGDGGTPETSESEAAPLVHRVCKGDTLSSLAARYLGSSDRFWELFVANRDRLRNPDLLTVGMELRIPDGAPAASREPPSSREPPPTLERPLAPLTDRGRP